MVINRRLVDREGSDFYPTPAWATMALLKNEPFSGTIWEPACGDGSMSLVLRDQGYHVISTDLYDRGYGRTGIDFLKEKRTVSNIITNPPFHLAEQFVIAGMQKATKKLALLLRLAFLESARRHRSIYKLRPPSRVLVFSDRITFYPKGMERKGSGTTAYAWFIWETRKINPTPTTELKWIPPGMKGKY